MTDRKLNIIGELMNNSYARARRAFTARSAAEYQQLARVQAELGAAYLTLNLDGTQRIQVRMEEMLAFLPEVIAAVQEVTTVPISFDNPSIKYHELALAHADELFLLRGRRIGRRLARPFGPGGGKRGRCKTERSSEKKSGNQATHCKDP